MGGMVEFLLPGMADFSKPYDPKETEGDIYKKWRDSGYLNPDKLPDQEQRSKKGSFTIVLPPPNVTGSLHMGHALNATIQDILIRKKRMEGFKTLWLPGTDHAGIATQNVVEKKLKKEGVTRHDLGKEKFLEKIWEWKEEYGNKILGQLGRIGASCDWDRARFTMDDGYKKAVEEAFLNYYNKGLIYQGERVINWCKRCLTSLSDLELEHEEEKGKLYFIKYPFKENPKSMPIGRQAKIQNSNYIVVATTRPETMLGDTAVAVNPKDERYKDLIGKILILPIVNREIPIIADDAIEKEFGTGAVKVTPNHSIIDSEIADRHNLPRITVINVYGKMTDEAGGDFAGISASDAREKVVAELESQGLIEKIEEHTHRVAKCYRCASIIEPQPSKQWFLKMSDLAEKTKQAIENDNVKFNDERWKKISLDWLSGIRDWCISRQIWWGHRLPVYFCKNKQEEVQNSKFKIQSLEDFELSKKCSFCGDCEMEQSEDVLDTWFSSALWPFATLGWPDKNSKDLKEFFPTQVLSTARDIINLWVLRMVFSSIEFMDGQVPFVNVIIHPTVLAKSGQRMSKSLGTGVDPLDLIEKYGADATRFGLIYQMMGNQDMKFDESHLLAGKKFANKIWNISRFVITQNANLQSTTDNLQLKSESLKDDDREILEKLEKAIASVSGDIDKYQFGQALHTLYDFIWHDFADKYIESSKGRNTDDVKKVLSYTLVSVLKLLHPFMPFITEEIWNELPIKDKKLLIVENWPQ